MDIAKEFNVVLVTSDADPALDTEQMLERVKLAGIECTRVEAYLSTRDAIHLRFKPTHTPRWYTLRPIKARELNNLVADLRDPTGAELWTIVSRCLVAVPEMPWLESDHTVVDVMRGIKILSESGMERVAEQAGLAGVRELGAVVLRKAMPPASALAPFASPHG